MRRLDPKRLTFSRGLLIALGTLLSGTALGWAQPPAWVIVLVGAIGLLLILAGLRTLETPDPCGDPKVRLSRLAQGAKALAHNLAHFDNWWPAVEDEGFNDRLPDGRPTTHAEAMQTLLYGFAQFFSAAYTYQEQCRRHRPLESVRDAYKALGDDPAGPTDYSLMSSQLHVVGVRSTSGWGTVDARPIQLADFKVDIENDPRFVEDFKALRRLLLAAAPGTEARARLEAVEESARGVEMALIQKGYRP
jgi:hypothetical protein